MNNNGEKVIRKIEVYAESSLKPYAVMAFNYNNDLELEEIVVNIPLTCKFRLKKQCNTISRSDYDANGRVKESSRCAVENTTLVNSYAGIFMRWGANDHLIRGVNMSVFKKGMVLDGITSLGVIQNVNIHNQYSWPFYGIQASDHEKTSRLAQQNLENLVGIEFHRVDWGWLNQVFIIYANKGFVFEKSMNAADSSQWELGSRALPSLDISNSGCDLCQIAVEANFVNTGVGVNFSNSNLLGRVIEKRFGDGSVYGGEACDPPDCQFRSAELSGRCPNVARQAFYRSRNFASQQFRFSTSRYKSQ